MDGREGRAYRYYLSKKMILLLISALCFIAYSIILLSAPIQLFPEFFFYPWLVSKGLIPYKDFFDHHGFLTNLLLAPLTSNGAYLILILFIIIQLIQFGLVTQLIAQRIKKPFHFFFLLIFYCAFQFTVIGQQMWYDQWIAFFLITAWFFFEMKREGVGWILFALATMVKPTAFIFFLPFYLSTKNKKTIFGFIGIWLVAFFYFYQREGLGALWQQLIVFNTSYIQSTYKTFYLGISIKLLIGITIGYFAILALSILKKGKSTPLIFTFILGASFFLQGLSKVNLAISIPFFILLFAERLNDKNNKRLLVILFFMLFMIIGRDAWKTYGEIRNRAPYLSVLSSSEKTSLKKLISPPRDKNMLVLGNRPELYYYFDILPPESISLHFPWIDTLYPRTYSFEGIQTVIIPKVPGEYETIPSFVIKRLNESFYRAGQTASYTVWRYNKEKL
jgi:hypothetical protein